METIGTPGLQDWDEVKKSFRYLFNDLEILPSKEMTFFSRLKGFSLFSRVSKSSIDVLEGASPEEVIESRDDEVDRTHHASNQPSSVRSQASSESVTEDVSRRSRSRTIQMREETLGKNSNAAVNSFKNYQQAQVRNN